MLLTARIVLRKFSQRMCLRWQTSRAAHVSPLADSRRLIHVMAATLNFESIAKREAGNIGVGTQRRAGIGVADSAFCSGRRTDARRVLRFFSAPALRSAVMSHSTDGG